MRIDLHVYILPEVKVEKDIDDMSDVELKQNSEDKSVACFTQGLAKRSAPHGIDGLHSEPSQGTGRKKAKVPLQVRQKRFVNFRV